MKPDDSQEFSDKEEWQSWPSNWPTLRFQIAGIASEGINGITYS